MEIENTLAKKMETAGSGNAMLDAVCKKLLAHKNILAWILKTCVEEYKDCSVKEIEKNYIEGVPRVAQTAVHQDETAEDSIAVKGTGNEDVSIMEGTVTYDIRFEALNPTKLEQLITMIINVESQTDFYPGYPLPKRGIYYGSRMISSQYGTVFTRSHYEKIEKVYSIWVCINPPQYRKNSINLYSFHETQLLGSVVEKKENYDLMTVVMICLGDEDDKNCKGLIKLLSVLLSTEKNAEEKKKILKEEFHIAMTQTMETEAVNMCDYSKYVEDKAMKKGIAQGVAQGVAQGIAQGVIEGILRSLKNLMESTGMSADQAMAALKIPEEERAEYAGRLK